VAGRLRPPALRDGATVAIVLLEDLNEEPYVIDAHLNHLILAGKLDNAHGHAPRCRRARDWVPA
jgi:LD-carboxypeptidase C-terminal domain